MYLETQYYNVKSLDDILFAVIGYSVSPLTTLYCSIIYSQYIIVILGIAILSTYSFYVVVMMLKIIMISFCCS